MIYNDIRGQYANVRFNAIFNFNLNGSRVFSLKICVSQFQDNTLNKAKKKTDSLTNRFF